MLVLSFVQTEKTVLIVLRGPAYNRYIDLSFSLGIGEILARSSSASVSSLLVFSLCLTWIQSLTLIMEAFPSPELMKGTHRTIWYSWSFFLFSASSLHSFSLDIPVFSKRCIIKSSSVIYGREIKLIQTRIRVFPTEQPSSPQSRFAGVLGWKNRKRS